MDTEPWIMNGKVSVSFYIRKLERVASQNLSALRIFAPPIIQNDWQRKKLFFRMKRYPGWTS
jgi:hypothetical protein